MKKVLGSLVLLGLSSGMVNAAGYPPVHIVNSTGSGVNTSVTYAACNGEDAILANADSYTSPVGRGLCLITGITAQVLEDGGAKVVEAVPYVSSGTSYSQFAIIKDGPVYKVVRMVE